MSNWKQDAADANLRMAKKMLEQQAEVNEWRDDANRLAKAASDFLEIADRDTKTANALWHALHAHDELIEKRKT